MRRIPVLAVGLCVLSLSLPAFAGFAGTEIYIPSVGRGAGAFNTQFYTTVWLTNLATSGTVHFTFSFLKDGQSNLVGAPAFSDVLAPGQTRIYENVIENKLGISDGLGAARVTADGEVFVSARIYNQAHPTDNLGATEGLFFSGVPKSFAIAAGESASIQGINQGSSTENMRYNFDLVEATGNTCKVHIVLLDPSGATQGTTDVPMAPYGHVKLNVATLQPSVNTINGRVVASVSSGSGRVILAGEQLANVSSDSSGFEMSFKDSLLTPSGIGAVSHDSTLTGDGTTGSPLGLAIPANLTGAAATGSDVFAFHNSTAGSSVGNTVHATLNSPSLISSAIWGENAGSGNGVTGTTKFGIGVRGIGGGGASVGVGGYGIGPTGVGVLASHTGASAFGPALQIDNGTILVSGVNRPAFVVVANSGNIDGHAMLIDNVLTNGDPHAMLFVTQNLNPPDTGLTIYNPHPIGVFYAGGNWQIFNEDLAAMPTGASFNVLVIKR